MRLTIKRRLAKLEGLAPAFVGGRRIESLSDDELNAMIDARKPPGNKPAAEWTAEEIRAEIERVWTEIANESSRPHSAPGTRVSRAPAHHR
jgi:hypothetical protein